jgi:8-oxo-dGTP diphosphatase
VTVVRPEVCVGAVVCRDEHILLIQRANPPQAGRWSLPGGRVESGETLVEAVVREVREETGLAIEVERFLEAVERISDTYHFVILDYLARPVDLAAAPLAATDAADARWVHRSALESMDLADQLLDFLRHHRII